MEKNKLPYHKQKNFKVPEGYFETLDKRIMQRVTSMEAEEHLNLPSSTGFKVPENYFDNFETELFQKLEEEKKTPKVITLLNKEIFYYVAGAAAVFIALFSTMLNNPAQPVEFGDLEISTLEVYLYETLEPDVSQYFNEQGAFLSKAENTDVDFEAVYQYLNENVEEPAVLVNEK
ncbi:hypothetical protein [Salinimicrobium sp. GXAS 041]|uniref:hypothetical protein n=1 Tax=Salinimicrobium sp. GXAS 041 TaxID=3400806 RepID=UPI003C787995